MKFLVALAAALGVAAIAYASAADVGVQGGALQVGQDDNLRCTENVTVDWANDEGLGLADVVIAGFDDDCVNDDVYFYLEYLGENGGVIGLCPDDAGSESFPPAGGILINANPMIIDDDTADCDAADISDTFGVRVTIVGGGTTEADAPAD